MPWKQWPISALLFLVPCNLPEAIRVGAAIQADPQAATLANSLLDLFNLSEDERCRIGRAGKISFVTASVLRKLLQEHGLYSWIIDGGKPPSFVDTPFHCASTS